MLFSDSEFFPTELNQVGCDLPEECSGLGKFDTNILVRTVSQCLHVAGDKDMPVYEQAGLPRCETNKTTTRRPSSSRLCLPDNEAISASQYRTLSQSSFVLFPSNAPVFHFVCRFMSFHDNRFLLCVRHLTQHSYAWHIPARCPASFARALHWRTLSKSSDFGKNVASISFFIRRRNTPENLWRFYWGNCRSRITERCVYAYVCLCISLTEWVCVYVYVAH